jgi:hypothetical protein
LQVKFGSVNIGDQVASIPIKFTRDHLKSLNRCEEFFCGKQLTGSIGVLSNPPHISAEGDTLTQRQIVPDLEQTVGGVFTSKKFTVGPKAIGASLAFQISGIDIGELSHLANKEGRIVIKEVAGIEAKPRGRPPKSEDDDSEMGDDDDDEPLDDEDD